MFGPAEIFTFLFVMLGPLRLLAPWAQRTRGVDVKALRRIALWAFLVATFMAIAGGFVGRALLANWQVPTAALQMAGGIVFFLVALRQLLERYDPAQDAAAPRLPSSPFAAACQLVFPILLTPYGIATVIALFAASPDAGRTAMIIGLVTLVMFLDLIAMLLAPLLLVGVTVIILQVVGAVLAVLQVALAIQFILLALRDLGVLRT